MKIDTTIPHTGRIYDFVLGGQHNFEADRQAAQKMLEIMPPYPKWARLNRWFLNYVAEQWAAAGYTRVLDLASGLPTQGHFHESLPDATILYTDNDPIAVTYGQQILEGIPKKFYAQVDLRDPASLIREATRVFGERPQIAIGFIGVSYLLEDQVVKELARSLAEWSAPGSVMAVSLVHQYKNVTPEELRGWQGVMARSSAAARCVFTGRDVADIAPLLLPWKLDVSYPTAELLGVQELINADDWLDRTISVTGALLSHPGS